jgi:hypothetical protein
VRRMEIVECLLLNDGRFIRLVLKRTDWSAVLKKIRRTFAGIWIKIFFSCLSTGNGYRCTDKLKEKSFFLIYLLPVT